MFEKKRGTVCSNQIYAEISYEERERMCGEAMNKSVRMVLLAGPGSHIVLLCVDLPVRKYGITSSLDIDAP